MAEIIPIPVLPSAPNSTNLSLIWYQNDEKHAPGWWAAQ